MMGDGEMAEGQVWEAAAFAAHYKLDNLTVLADVNALGQSEPTMYKHDMEIYRRKFESEGWATEVIDGHDVASVLAALDRAKGTKGRPQAIIARTIKGHGFSQVAGKLNWHGKPFSKEQLADAIKEIGGGPTWCRRTPENPTRAHHCRNLRTSLPLPRRITPKMQSSRDTRGLRLRAEAAGRRESADSGDFGRREEFDIFGSIRRRLSRTISIRAISRSRTW